MKSTLTRVREVVSSELELKVSRANINDNMGCVKCRCNVDGHDWEVRLHLADLDHGNSYCRLALELVFLGESRTNVTAILTATVTDPSGYDVFEQPKVNKSVPKAFHRPLDRSLPFYIGVTCSKAKSRASNCCSFTVKCTITVLIEPAAAEEAFCVPSSDIHLQLGELLHSRAAADVTFSVSGESFTAHKSVLAARSTVFMAEFFGEEKVEGSYQRVEIKDMDVGVFKALLHFIYTDAVPELDEMPGAAAMALAENLLVPACRYRLDRLKLMCERRLALGMDVSTVASLLVVAEQRNFSQLKAKCIEFIVQGSPENLNAVLATEGYKHLLESSPMLLTELLKAACGKNSTGLLQDRSPLQQSFTSTQLNEGVQSVHVLKIDGFLVTSSMLGKHTDCIKSRCTIDGYDFEIRFYPAESCYDNYYLVVLKLAFLGEASTQGVEASISGHIVEFERSVIVAPREPNPVSKVFKNPMDCTPPICIGKGKASDSNSSPSSLSVKCTITVFRDLKAIRPPSSDIHQHLDKLLQSQVGADVMFSVSGESFAAHKNILAARSPVFKAEFFGEMVEKTSKCVEITDMDPEVFKAMLHFIYTDMMPGEFVNQLEAVDRMAMAQHLLVAADRYGLDRLRIMSEQRLSLSISIDTVASALALAAQLNCSRLKAKCIEFMIEASSEELDTIMATEGYMHLEVSSPSLLTELLKAAHRNKRSRSTDA
jgi:speckle-type POZ protein